MNTFFIRKYIIGGIIILFFIIIAIKLFYLQVINQSYKLSASNNVLRSEILFPARGLIFDRDSNLLVFNEAAYDLMLIPGQLREFDTVDFCNILSIDKQQLELKISEAVNYSKYKPSIFLKQVSSITYAKLQEKLFKFPGFFVQPRTLRKYSYNNAAHILGYVGEVDLTTIQKDFYYIPGDYIGISGIEKSYEIPLRGEKGVKIYLVDVHNRIKGSYKDGRFDSPSITGRNIHTTLNLELQKYGEKLMQNKIGSIVVIEPTSGEIIAMISSPAYNPNLLVGRVRTKNYNELSKDTLNPLFNRSIMAQYPPGSPFKLVNGLIALQEKVIWYGTEFSCNYGFYAKGISVGCHAHYSPLNFTGAIQNSCNTYFCNVLKRIIENKKYDSYEDAFKAWKSYIQSFSFGSKVGSDFANEVDGIIPSVNYYNKYYGKNGWGPLTIISLAIGQGELGATPLQMANMVTTIANRGFYYVPHIVKSVEGYDSIDIKYRTRHYIPIDSIYFEYVVKGMELAVNGGEGSTAWKAKMNDIIVCGKTGTAENPFGEDHSIFVAFAPKKDPEIAIAVYIENGGWGNTWAAPIARLMIEKYINDTISDPWLEKYILDTKLLDRGKKKDKLIKKY